jgi:hypothetical protein
MIAFTDKINALLYLFFQVHLLLQVDSSGTGFCTERTTALPGTVPVGTGKTGINGDPVQGMTIFSGQIIFEKIKFLHIFL